MGEEGIELAGGQRERLTLALALLSKSTRAAPGRIPEGLELVDEIVRP